MSALLFLGGALVIFLMVALVSWFRHRERNVSFESSIERFKHEMRVLAPDDEDPGDAKRH